MKDLLLIIAILGFVEISGQTIHKSYSENCEYFFRSISYGDLEDKSLGKTIVYSKDSVEIYSINRFFDCHLKRRAFLSNDGKSLVYIISKEYDKSCDDQKGIILYNNGNLIKEYLTNEIVDCDCQNEDCYLLFWDIVEDVDNRNGRNFTFNREVSEFEEFLCDTNAFIKNDTVLLFLNDYKVLRLNLENGDYDKVPFESYNKELLASYKLPNLVTIKYDIPWSDGLPNLSNGKKFKKSLAKHLDLRIYPYETRYSEYLEYHISVKCLIDNKGNAEVVEIDAHDSIPRQEVKEFIENVTFSTSQNALYSDKTAYNEFGFGLMNKSKTISRIERQKQADKEKKEYQIRLVAYTINGFYIPKNIEECFLQLNKLLKPKDISTIKELESSSETILYHHGLGTYLRNNWGLWGGSRLQKYFQDRGIDHPDSMSGIILRLYYDWLNDNNDEWTKFDKQ